MLVFNLKPMRKLVLAFISIMFVLSLAGCGNDGGPAEGDMTNEEKVALAQCLTDKGVKMYGAIWCSHCKKQKDAFGEAFQYVDYVECDPNTNIESARECIAAEVEGVPAWDFPDGTRKTGEVPLPELAELAGC